MLFGTTSGASSTGCWMQASSEDATEFTPLPAKEPENAALAQGVWFVVFLTVVFGDEKILELKLRL